MENKKPTKTSGSGGTNMEEKIPKEPPERKGISRRSFVKTLAAAGAGVTVLSAVAKNAKADAYGAFAADNLSEAQLKAMYKRMWLMRHWELKDKDESLKGRIDFVGHLYVGEEACALGAITALNKDDKVVATHRGHGCAIAKGVDPTKAFMEQLYRVGGTNKGYGGSMHVADKSVGMLGANSIVGASVYIGAGAAYGMKVRGNNEVVISFFGDGGLQNSVFCSALNQATYHKLPWIAFCENNGYGITIPVQNVTASKDLAERAQGFGLPGHVVDGQDVLAVYGVTKRAVDRARNGDGPTLIEAKTYRYFHHYGVAGGKIGQVGVFGLAYRSDRELRHWLGKDPLRIFGDTLIRIGVMNAQEAKEVEAKVKKEIDDAFEAALKSPQPPVEEALKTNYYSGMVVRATQLG